MNKLVTILGPTAVGKTDLSLALARQYGAELISGDAYQVYCHMDIGTAKPSPEEYGSTAIISSISSDPGIRIQQRSFARWQLQRQKLLKAGGNCPF